MKPRSISPALLLIGALPFLGAALPARAEDPSASLSALPAERSQGAVSYISGGIGLDESTAMKAAASKYPLELVFAAREGGNYLAGSQVVIRKRSGETLLETTADGPFLLAKIPSGRYLITATHEGRALERAVTIAPRQHRRVVFVW